MQSLLGLCLCFVLNQIQASETLLSIPDNAAKELPAGVPRTVDTNGRVIYIDGMFTTKAYQQEAFRLIIEEANKVAMELHLPETLPITKTNITRAYIGPFGYNYQLKGLGSVDTLNYSYGVEKGYKFSDLTITKIDDRCREYAVKYQWPLNRLDTNAAFQLATQWLAAAHMDVQGLNRGYDVRVALDGYWNNVKMGELPKRKFTPLYIISWLVKGKPPYSAGGGASVELFLPTKTLLSLSVNDPKYILRPPLAFTNLAALFPGKATITTNWPVKTEFPPLPGTE